MTHSHIISLYKIRCVIRFRRLPLHSWIQHGELEAIITGFGVLNQKSNGVLNQTEFGVLHKTGLGVLHQTGFAVLNQTGFGVIYQTGFNFKVLNQTGFGVSNQIGLGVFCRFTTYRHRFARAAPAPRAKRNEIQRIVDVHRPSRGFTLNIRGKNMKGDKSLIIY